MRVTRRLLGGRLARETGLCSGPGKLTQALGIWLGENGGSLARGPVRIYECSPDWRAAELAVGTRLGHRARRCRGALPPLAIAPRI